MKSPLWLGAFALFMATTAYAQNAISYPPECVQGNQHFCARLQAHNSGTVRANGYCANLTNNSANDYFIPLRTSKEIEAFVTNASSIGVQVSVCCPVPHCGQVQMPIPTTATPG
jgi:hypothetical protein